MRVGARTGLPLRPVLLRLLRLSTVRQHLGLPPRVLLSPRPQVLQRHSTPVAVLLPTDPTGSATAPPAAPAPDTTPASPAAPPAAAPGSGTPGTAPAPTTPAPPTGSAAAPVSAAGPSPEPAPVAAPVPGAAPPAPAPAFAAAPGGTPAAAPPAAPAAAAPAGPAFDEGTAIAPTPVPAPAAPAAAPALPTAAAPPATPDTAAPGTPAAEETPAPAPAPAAAPGPAAAAAPALATPARRPRTLTAFADVLDTVLAPSAPAGPDTDTDAGTPSTAAALGIRALDDLLGPLQPGRLYLVAAAPGVGGSLLATAAARTTALERNLPVLYAASGPTAADVTARIVAAHLPLDYRRLRAGQLTDGERDDVRFLYGELAAAPLSS